MSRADDFLQLAGSMLGKPYVWGEESPTRGFDCSGLVQWAAAAAGVKLPRTAEEQQRATQSVANPVPGDLVFWGTPAYHVGIYIGGGKMINAPNSREVVRIQDVWGKPSGYGRIPGFGGAAAPFIAGAGAVVDAASSALGTATHLLGGARTIVLQSLAIVAGVGLVGVGLVRAVATHRRKETTP